jgi:methyl-accepting chemotaxis protein
MNALNHLRQKASTFSVLLLWINVVLLAIAQFMGTGLSLMVLGLSALLAMVGTAFLLQDREGATIRIVNSMGLGAQVAILVYEFTGSPYQIDMHMYFFATLAICAAWVDWRAIVANASLVAVHHVLFFLILPAAIFPGESDFGRVLLHAVVLVVQAGALIAVTSALVKTFAIAVDATESAVAAQKQAQERTEDVRLATEASAQERSEREKEKAAEARLMEIAVERIGTALTELSSGNMSYRIDEQLVGRIDGLRTNFNDSMTTLEIALQRVDETAIRVRQSSSSISGANAELASRTSRQAASVEETAAAISEISETVSNTAKVANEVGKLVGNAVSGAEKSASIVTSAVSAMSRIEESSGQISQIIGVIDEIAFQTNLLALNAGVEAARAGDAGKGFAVVAQEVRELAQRSANAAKEIKALITTSAEQVKSGVALVGETGMSLRAIEEEVRQISQRVEMIVSATREQSGALHNINGALNEIDQNTQKSAAIAQETSTAVESLAEDATMLESLIGNFRLSGDKDLRGSFAAAGKKTGRRAA